MTETFETLFSELASQRARYEELRANGAILDAIDARSHLHTLRAKIATIQAPWDA